jgi:hypothetical protein
MAASGTASADTPKEKTAPAAKAETKSDAKSHPDHDAMMAEMMKYANPGPQHQALNPLAGNWKTVTKMWMGPGEPEVSNGTCERSWALGGRFLVSNYKGTFSGKPFEGMELLGYDLRKQQYVSTWIDNMGTGFSVSENGTMDPATKSLTLGMSFDDPMTNQKMAYKIVTKITDDNSHTFSMIGSREGKDFTEMEIAYTRVK